MTVLRVIPLGGLGEIGKNMMVLEYGQDIIVIDAGLMFPEEEMLGVDMVIPDISYLKENRGKVRGIIITHGHEDHIGALPYILTELLVPIFATPLTQALIGLKLKERKLLPQASLNTVSPGDEVSLGAFKVGFFSVCHSIPDALGLAIQTPLGVVVHSGDFKLDHTPVGGRLTDLSRLARLGEEGVLLLLSDSTYVEVAGYTPSERAVAEVLQKVIAEAPGRVIISTFASQVSRAQQVMEIAQRLGKKVFLIGKGMVDTVEVAEKVGFLKPPPGVVSPLSELPRLPPRQVVILCTGSQGEPTSALVRMANRDHPQVRITPGDTVVISATPIPGNETVVSRTIDNLFRLGATVLYDRIAPVHVHGHGSQEELKMMLSLTRPRFFVPVHGEYRHLALHAQLATSLGVPDVFLLEDGDILELSPEGGRVVGSLPLGNVFVDGLTVGEVDSVVFRDRRHLSEDGLVVVIVTMDKQSSRLIQPPEVISRGLGEMPPGLQERVKKEVTAALEAGHAPLRSGLVQVKVKELVTAILYRETRKRPMVLPISIEV